MRWKNYCSDDDTWEPEAHLEDCREVLLAFKTSMADAKAKRELEAKKAAVSRRRGGEAEFDVRRSVSCLRENRKRILTIWCN